MYCSMDMFCNKTVQYNTEYIIIGKFSIESIKTTSMEDVSIRVLEEKKNI